jgi:hypothetical protein
VAQPSSRVIDAVGAVWCASGRMVDDFGLVQWVRRGSWNVSSGSTDSLLIAGADNTYVRVLAVTVLVKAEGPSQTVTFNSKPNNAAGVAISPAWLFAGGGGIRLDYNDDGWLQTNNPGDAVTVSTGLNSATASISLQWIYVSSAPPGSANLSLAPQFNQAPNSGFAGVL